MINIVLFSQGDRALISTLHSFVESSIICMNLIECSDISTYEHMRKVSEKKASDHVICTFFVSPALEYKFKSYEKSLLAYLKYKEVSDLPDIINERIQAFETKLIGAKKVLSSSKSIHSIKDYFLYQKNSNLWKTKTVQSLGHDRLSYAKIDRKSLVIYLGIYEDIYIDFKSRVNMHQFLWHFYLNKSWFEKNSQKNNFYRLSFHDDVTTALNQRALYRDIQKSLVHHKEMPFTLLFLDVDNFKKVNDSYGHVVGSTLLMDMSKIIRSSIRREDNLYRYGGDEFVVFLSNISNEVAYNISRRIKDKIEQFIFKADMGEHIPLTVSIGIACYPNDAHTLKKLVNFADKMMYESKKNGRNKIFHVSEVS